MVKSDSLLLLCTTVTIIKLCLDTFPFRSDKISYKIVRWLFTPLERKGIAMDNFKDKLELFGLKRVLNYLDKDPQTNGKEIRRKVNRPHPSGRCRFSDTEMRWSCKGLGQCF